MVTIDPDFNKESLIKFGMEWPIFNAIEWCWKLGSDFSIHPCPLHNFLLGFEGNITQEFAINNHEAISYK